MDKLPTSLNLQQYQLEQHNLAAESNSFCDLGLTYTESEQRVKQAFWEQLSEPQRQNSFTIIKQIRHFYPYCSLQKMTDYLIGNPNLSSSFQPRFELSREELQQIFRPLLGEQLATGGYGIDYKGLEFLIKAKGQDEVSERQTTTLPDQQIEQQIEQKIIIIDNDKPALVDPLHNLEYKNIEKTIKKAISAGNLKPLLAYINFKAVWARLLGTAIHHGYLDLINLAPIFSRNLQSISCQLAGDLPHNLNLIFEIADANTTPIVLSGPLDWNEIILDLFHNHTNWHIC